MNKLKKIIVCSILVLSSLTPIRAHAQYVDVFNLGKEGGLDLAAWIVADTMIEGITNETINWVNSGFKDNPSFVTDPSKFFLDIGENELNRFISNSNISNICTPFRDKITIALISNYQKTTEKTTFSCTLDKLKDNYDNFINDFDQGGWDSWFELVQNNPYSSYQDAERKLAISISDQQQKYKDQLDWGQGFLSYEKCSPSSDPDLANYGVEDCQTLTPGTVINDQLEKALGSGLNRITQADELSEVISGFINHALSAALNNGLSSITGDEGSDEKPPEPYDTGSVDSSEGGYFECPDGDLAHCDITINKSSPGNNQTPEELIRAQIKQVERELARAEAALREMQITGCGGIPLPDCIDKMRDQQEKIRDLLDRLKRLNASLARYVN